jgi:hypothetical protein
MVGKRVQVFLQLIQGHFCANGKTVVDNVEAGALEIDYFLAAGPSDVRIPDVPLLGDVPIENGRPGGNFVQFQWDMPLNQTERLTKAIACDASA